MYKVIIDSLPQELIDLGYSLTRNHSVKANFGIVGSTNLSYNAPQNNENVGELSRNISDCDFLDRQNIGITLTTLDAQKTYSLGNTNLNIPSEEYNIQITNAPTDSRPQLIHRESSLVNAPEKEIELTQDGNAYVGTIALDFTNSTSTQIFKLSPIPVEGPHTVTIDPNGGTINDEYLQTEVIEGESYSLPLRSRAGLEIPGYTLVGFEVTEGILLDTEGNPLSEIPTSTSRSYTLESDVTLSVIWEKQLVDSEYNFTMTFPPPREKDIP